MAGQILRIFLSYTALSIFNCFHFTSGVFSSFQSLTNQLTYFYKFKCLLWKFEGQILSSDIQYFQLQVKQCSLVAFILFTQYYGTGRCLYYLTVCSVRPAYQTTSAYCRTLLGVGVPLKVTESLDPWQLEVIHYFKQITINLLYEGKRICFEQH